MSSILSILIPLHVTKIGEEAFSECDIQIIEFDEKAIDKIEIKSVYQKLFTNSH